jgi:GT2 family glycosyltransferase/glycosyltransferase involved in cell wall biosynthesis
LSNPQSAIRNPQSDLPSVSVVVLNYNGLKHLEPCFTSLLALDYPADRLELMLVDNGSRDDSVEFMRERFPAVRVVETGSNLGFAAGNNYGAEHATGEYVAFLNNDTRVEPDWLSELVKSVISGRDEGVVCTGSLMLDWTGAKIDFQAGGVNFHGFGFQPSYGKPYKPGEVAPRDLLFACGGSMLIDRALFNEIGGFDPDYFAFFEDVDLGWRLWLLGYRVTLTPAAITYHRHHGTAGSMPEHRTYVLYERNALYTIFKNYEEEHVHTILSAALLLLGGRAVRFIEAGGSDLSDFEWNNPDADPEPDMNVHRHAVAGLLAANEFMDNLGKFQEKRAWLQARRVRNDRELFALFGQSGRVNWINHTTDARYATTHYDLLDLFGIADLWGDLPKEVLVISPDVLPVGDIPASGSGIRAWALGKGLEGEGHHVHYTMPAPAIKGREGSVPQEYVDGAWTPANLQSIIDAMVPDVIVSCGWPNLTWTPRLNVPVAVDLTGPHLFERAYQGYRDTQTNSREKLAALARADYFTCIGERQKYYFEAWLAQAGVRIEDLMDALAVVPYSVDPQLPPHHWPQEWTGTDVRFVYGGIFLPWQNPAPALTTVTSTLEEHGRGTLEVIGGKHPFYPVHTGDYGPLIERLSVSTRVRMSGLLPHGELVDRYTHAHVALDMIMPNAERELAFPSRTVHYMWCGLPVIHPAFSEVAGHIRRYEAGWVVAHDDSDALREVVLSILAHPEEARRRGANAQRLASEVFAWDKTTGPLARFVRRPTMRHERAENARLDQAGTAGGGPATGHRPTRTGAPGGYLIADTWNKKLPEKLDRVYGKRRSLPAQVASRSRGFLRSLAPALVGRRARAVDGQMRAALPELVAGHSHGQRFLCPRNGLSGIVLAPATFGRTNTCRLVLHIRTNPGAQADIHSVDLPAHEMKDGQPLAFRFMPIPDSAGRWFYFVADSPDGVPGDAISLYAAPYAEDLQAQRYEDGLPADGALVMALEFN